MILELHISDTYCDPNFFDPEQHMKHINLNDTVLLDLYWGLQIINNYYHLNKNKNLNKNKKCTYFIC